MEQLNYWQLLAGLGLFLFGMSQMETGLKGLGTRTFKLALRRYSQTPLRGVITGTAATAFMQSSSVVGLIVLAFVGAGILELRHALGIIFGSNLGTTFTGWIVTLLGFKLDLDGMSLPLLAMGTLATLALPKNNKPFYIASMVLGLGFLLFGLGYMKDSMALLSNEIDVAWLQDYSLWVFLLAGAVFTAIIQSSSATMMLILSALYSDIVVLEQAAALVIGADLGTTSTLLLGGMMRSNAEKKRVAMAHLCFNLVTDVIAFIILMPLLALLKNVFSLTDPMYTLVAFHSSFNLIGVALFVPASKYFAAFLERLFVEQEHVASSFINNVPAGITDAAVEAVEKDTSLLMTKTILFCGRTFKVDAEQLLPNGIAAYQLPIEVDSSLSYEQAYDEIKEIEGELIAYIHQVQNESSDPHLLKKLTLFHHGIREISYAAKTIKDVRHNLVEFRHETRSDIHEQYAGFLKAFKALVHQLASLLALKSAAAFDEKRAVIAEDIKAIYQHNNHAFTSKPLVDSVSDVTLSSLLNVNKALWLFADALLDATEGARPEDL